MKKRIYYSIVLAFITGVNLCFLMISLNFDLIGNSAMIVMAASVLLMSFTGYKILGPVIRKYN